jgi:hypothetical protein
MLRRLLRPLMGLILVFSLSLALPPLVRAACEGYCADRSVSSGDYNGCTIHRDASDQVYCVQCYYSGSRGDIITIGVVENGNCSGVN